MSYSRNNVFIKNEIINKSRVGVDVLTASQQELLRYGIPTRPHAGDQAFKLWKYLALANALPSVAIVDNEDFRTSYNRIMTKGHFATSRNWCGGVISAPYASNKFRTIYATWTVPAILPDINATNGEERSSIWVGFDGYRRWSRSLPQVGITAIRNSDGTSGYVAWYQWWLKNGNSAPFDYKGLYINAGDTVVCSLDVLSSTKVLINLLIISDIGIQPTWPVIMEVPSDHALSSLDAECIVERPMKICSTERYPLCRIDKVEFECRTLKNFAFASNDFLGATLVKMVHEVPSPNRVEHLAIPARPSASAHQVTAKVS